VVEYDAHGVLVAGETLDFPGVWKTPLREESDKSATTALAWDELLVPLPDVGVPCLGYAMTYPSHQAEVRIEDSYHFAKGGPAEKASRPIEHRPNLDYEAEVGMLVRRGETDRFGYVMINDLTDRGVQVRTYDKDNPAPGFSEAKSFPGALRVGPLLVLGNEACWHELDVILRVNGVQRQHVKARECLLSPPQFHKQAFAAFDAEEWILISTGTSEGVVFKTPSTIEKLVLFLKGGFSMEGAEQELLDSMVFLNPGDTLDMESQTLGVSHAPVIEK
jgi:2-keto-4-pentenoate hydratase/2-oxohepta-3-ene-1,7-dioic acid hydratase in catechol pathway